VLSRNSSVPQSALKAVSRERDIRTRQLSCLPGYRGAEANRSAQAARIAFFGGTTDEFPDSTAPGWDYWGGQGQDLMYLMSSSGSASASPTELSAAP